MLQYAGDNLLAAFGADEAAEDDAERAVRCGLALLELGTALRAEVEAAHGLAASTCASASTPAACCSAAASTTRAASAARRSTSPRAWSRPRRPARCASATTPTAMCAASSTSSRSRRSPSRASTSRSHLPGAARQAARVPRRHARHRGRRDAHGRPRRRTRGAAGRVPAPVRPAPGCSGVIVVGEAGVGKSRLLYEFENWAEARPERFVVFQARATPQTQGQPYGLLRDLFAWRCQIGDGDSMDAAQRKLESGADAAVRRRRRRREAAGARPPARPADRPGLRRSRHVARHPRRRAADPQPRLPCRGAGCCAASRARTARRSWSCSTTCTGPTTARSTSSSYLAQVNRDVPMLMVVLTRPTLFERRADWRRRPGRAPAHRSAAARRRRQPDARRRVAEEARRRFPPRCAS